MAEAITYFQRRWVETCQPADGKPPTLTEADRGQLVRLLGAHGLDALKALVDRFLADDDAFLVKTAYALKHLPSRVDGYRLGARASPRVVGHAKPAPHNTETREYEL